MKEDVRKRNVVSKKKFPPRMTGLSGIMELFNVSKSTAWKYKNTWLGPAITQKGRLIFIDTKKALKLMGMEHPELLVKMSKPSAEEAEDAAVE